MENISSKDNSLVKLISKLKIKKHRVQEEKFIVEGIRFVSEALSSDFNVLYVLISKSFLSKYDENNIKDLITNKTKVYVVEDNIFKNISSTKTPQGIMCIVENKKVHIGNNDGFYVLADKIQDPGNLGTIIRTAHASGALGVIVSKGTVDVYNEKTLRSTMGSIFKVPVIEDNNLDYVKSLKEHGYLLITSSLQNSENFFELDMTRNLIITVGNEGNGVSDEVFEISDLSCKIPMPGDAESLNAAVAASIMMYEVVRQKSNNFKK